MQAITEGVWIQSDPVSFLGLQLTTNMTALRLADGGLLLHSPGRFSPARRAEIDALGPVNHLYAPNLFHHLWLEEWVAAYPAACLHAPADLAKKRSDLTIRRRIGVDPAAPEFAGALQEISVQGFRLQETVLFHNPSRTLVVTDLLQNVGRPEHGWTKIYTKMMGFYDRVALSGAIRLTAFSNRTAARKSIDELLALPFERLVLGHGAPLTAHARAALADAYKWL